MALNYRREGLVTEVLSWKKPQLMPIIDCLSYISVGVYGAQRGVLWVSDRKQLVLRLMAFTHRLSL